MLVSLEWLLTSDSFFTDRSKPVRLLVKVLVKLPVSEVGRLEASPHSKLLYLSKPDAWKDEWIKR